MNATDPMRPDHHSDSDFAAAERPARGVQRPDPSRPDGLALIYCWLTGGDGQGRPERDSTLAAAMPA